MLKNLISYALRVLLVILGFLNFSWSMSEEVLDSELFDPYKRIHISRWVPSADPMEVVVVGDLVADEYADRVDEIPTFDESHRFTGYKYPPCSRFDGNVLLSCVAHKGPKSRVLSYGGERAGNLSWKIALTGVGEIILGDPEKVEQIGFLEEDTAISVVKFSPLNPDAEDLEAIDVIIASHTIDAMGKESLGKFLERCFSQLKENGDLHLLWKHFSEPYSEDMDYAEDSDRPLFLHSSDDVKKLLKHSNFTIRREVYIGDTLATFLDPLSLPKNYFIALSAKKSSRKESA